jgi:hypothetical protein
MSNQAILFAEDTPAAYNPEQKGTDRQANTLHIAGAAYQIPVFWLFCFAEEDFVDVHMSQGRFSTLVTNMGQVRRRLTERDTLAREFFPAHAGIWSHWRAVIEAVDRRYLKLDPYEIWLLYKEDYELGGMLYNALDWFDPPHDQRDLDFLLGLAGIEDYSRECRAFPIKKNECPERFLVGFGLDVEVS